MDIKYVAKNYKISDKFKDVVEKKLARIEKYFDRDVDVKVSCTEQNDRCKLELTINSRGLYLRSEVESDNMYSNLDICVAKLEKQVVKYMGKTTKRIKTIDFSDFEYFDELPEIVIPKITKRKQFKLVPMSEQEALMQMDMVGNDFFVFMNSATDTVCVLYKREDGDAGLIETM